MGRLVLIPIIQLPGIILAIYTIIFAINELTGLQYLSLSKVMIIASYALLFELNLPKIIQRICTEQSNSPSLYFDTTLKVSLIAGAITFLLFNAFFAFDDYRISLVISLNTVLLIILNYLLLFYEIERKYIFVNITRQIVNIFASASLLFCLVRYSMEIDEIVIFTFFFRNLFIFFLAALFVRRLRLKIKFTGDLTLREVFNAQYLTVRNIIDMSMISLDKVVVGMIVSGSSILVLNAAPFDLAMKALLLLTPIISILFSNAMLENNKNYEINQLLAIASILLVVSAYPLYLFLDIFTDINKNQFLILATYLIGVYLTIPNVYYLSQLFAANKEKIALHFSLFYIFPYYASLILMVWFEVIFAFCVSFTAKVIFELVYFKVHSNNDEITLNTRIIASISVLLFGLIILNTY